MQKNEKTENSNRIAKTPLYVCAHTFGSIFMSKGDLLDVTSISVIRYMQSELTCEILILFNTFLSECQMFEKRYVKNNQVLK